MKKIRLIFPFFVLIAIFWSCKKEENVITYQGGTAPILISSVATGDTIVFNTADTSVQALALSWTNPDYTFSNGPSSLNVNYAIEIDTLGADFSSPVLQTITIVSSLSRTLSVGQLNAALSNMNLTINALHTIQIRVESYLGVSGAPLYSNVFNYTVTPFAVTKVPLPSSGNLYLVGDITATGALSNWSNSSTPDAAQLFTQVSPTEYQITVAMVGGTPSDATSVNEFLFIPVAGSWNSKFAAPVAGQNNGVFEYVTGGGNNFQGPTVAGNYLIDVNFKTGVFTVTKQ
jgi:hypothetical protein